MKRQGELRRVIKRLGRYRWMLALSVLLSAVYVVLTLYTPILTGRAIDLAVGRGRVDMEGIGKILAAMVIIALAGAVVQWIMNLLNNRVSFGILADLRNEAFSRIQILPTSYLDSHPTGDLVNRMTADADQFADGLLMGFTQLFTGAATIIGSLVFMISVNLKIALAVVVLTPVSLFIARFIAKHTYAMFREQSAVRGEQTAFIDEMLSGQKVVRAFSREKLQLAAFDSINKRLSDCSLKAIFFSSLTNPTTRFVNNLIYAVVALFGALVCTNALGFTETLTVGALVSLLSYVNQYTKPFNEISGVITELQNSLASASRLFDLIDEQPQTPDDEDAVQLDKAQGDVRLENVDFSYTPDRELIKGLCLDVSSGMRIAIVGPTGCGKTTLINLLMRFYDVTGGEISVDGTDIRHITRRSLRANYGMVLQETWLRSGTIRENITAGRPDASDEEVIAAAKASHAHSFIRRLPRGYDTYIGEDGGSLSQGQKQLLCITRIMLTLPPMLILDEATSSIDTRTEILIQRAFAQMMKGRTSFIVAHRLSTIKEADMILVMKDGHIIEKGRHEELLKQGGFYTELFNSQFSPT
ncbi:MAG: ABC transporter ATP-binding protein [Oscillospiraceae bacterium]|nr:ABC transporter ATP-binding protein [Oscillospiraceae bacterium]